MSIKIDFNNKTHITYIIISIIILFGTVYVWKNCNCNKDIEAFIQYDVSSSDIVTLNSLGNVVVGNNGKTLDDILDTSYYKINTGKTLEDNTQQKITDLSTNITTTNTAFTNEINQKIQNLTQNMDSNIQKLTKNMDSNIQTLTKKMDDNIQTLTQNMDDNTPELSVSAYYKTTAPPGWQICNGDQLKAMDGIDVYYKTSTTTTGPTLLKTPDLRGRSILGANLAGQNNNTSFTTSLIGNSGGKERHTLSREELPTHYHYYLVDNDGGYNLGHGGGNYNVPIYKGENYAWRVTPGDIPNSKNTDADSDQPHNNMHPVYVLNYIIKQPKLGGDTNSILLQEAPSTSTISFLK